jgi:hypothetical protein
MRRWIRLHATLSRFVYGYGIIQGRYECFICVSPYRYHKMIERFYRRAIVMP